MMVSNLRRLPAWLGLAAAAVGTASLAGAATFTEDFSTPPAQRGWEAHGEASLFQWNAAQGWLEVAWDSSRSNSYFRRPLGVILAKTDSFTLGFDLCLLEARIGVNPEKPYSFEVALGFHNSWQAVRETFQRGRGVGHSPNLVEFDYFPEYYNPEDLFSHHATVWPTFTSTNGSFNYSGPNDFRELVLPTNTWLRVRMVYDGATRLLSTTLRASPTPFAPGEEGAVWLALTTPLAPSFTDFRVDTFAVASYSDAGAGGSLYARGYVDNVTWTVPDAPVQGLHTARTANGLELRWQAAPDHRYGVEASADLRQWTPQQAPAPGTGGWLSWPLGTLPAERRFFRIAVTRP